jgi:Skp family chaperone for outer membrane proteins
MQKAKASVCLALFSCALQFSLMAQAANGLSVASGELESAKGRDLAFVNYEGPQSRIDSAADIVAIGLGLGRELPPPSAGAAKAGAASQPAAARRAGNLDRYAVIRAVDPSVAEGLDADIIVIGADAEVDHVKNLRRIISGYLQAAWGYGSADASTLAVYVTVYNAVHRGDLAYFKARYKAVVMGELSAGNAGLSLRYDEWAGKSRIVIPLSRKAKSGALGAVDTGAVSDKATTEKLRAEPGASVGDRQAMTELKSREVEQRQGELSASEADAAAKQAALDAEKAKLATDAGKAAAPGTAAPAGPAATTASPAAPAGAAAQPTAASPAAGGATAAAPSKAAAQPSGSTAEASATGTAAAAPASAGADAKDIAGREAEVKAREADLAAKQAELDRQKSDNAAESSALAAKKEEVATERATVAADQKTAIAAEVASKNAAEAAGIYLFQLIDSANPFARILFVDTATGKLIRASTLNSIRPQSMVDGGDFFVAVAGKEGGTGAVRLVRLAKSDLSQGAESKLDIFAGSGLWSRDGAFFAVAKDGSGGYALVRFDAELKETARSPQAVNPWTALSFTKEGAIVQGAGGGFLLLSPDKLELVRELKP